ncbi:MAG: MmgE/PrpD family protein [Anaerolineae bacterium]|nr:MmgE/PrpD family protein [Anaerolineae bacterium]
MAEQSLTESLAAWLVDFRARPRSNQILSVARYYLLDWLGSAIAGGATGPGARLIGYAKSQPAGNCSVIGTNLAGSAEVAALVNGALSHIVEMDDLDRGSVIHPGAAIIPAALAIAEQEKLNGHAFLTAIAAGYEVAIRIGEAVGKKHYHYFHNTATCGIFGAAAAVGHLLELEAEQLVWALGNAGTQAAGLWEFNTDGAMSKHLHAGRAAAGGVLAAVLAARGFTGARSILEGDRGFFAATAPDANPEKVIAGLTDDDRPLKINGVSIKPHASCRHTHPAIDATLSLREQIGDKTVEAVEILSYQAALDLCDNPSPQTPYAAKFSLQYCVASALQRGSVALADFTPEAINAADLRAILTRITARVNPDFEARYPNQWPARVRVTLADGTTLRATVEHPKGDPENPLSMAELEQKFGVLAAFGGQGDKVEALLAWLESLANDAPVAG